MTPEEHDKALAHLFIFGLAIGFCLGAAFVRAFP